MLSRRVLPLVLMAGGLAACHDGADRNRDGSTSALASATTTRGAPPVPQELYTMELRLPDLPPTAAPLHAALDRYVEAQKRSFFASLEAPGARERARDMPWDLDLDIALAARTDRFINVQVDGSAFTGGAHPAPIVASFTYDLHKSRVVGLAELFDDPQAAEVAFATAARRQLLTALDDEDDPLPSDSQQIDAGTAPGKNHYQVFGLLTGTDDKVHGLSFIFPPYQVAPYAAGSQVIDVPSGTFAALLKPEYREAFR
jgi:hypothetical protein